MAFQMCTLKIVNIRYFVATQKMTMRRRMKGIPLTLLHSAFKYYLT